MPQLQQLMPPMDDVKGQAFPLLQELRMEDCPKLETILPHYLLPSLSVLDTTDGQMKQLVASLPKAPRIRSMRFVDHLGYYKLASGLHNLKVHGSESTLETLLERIESLGFADSTLQGLELRGCNEIRSIPLWRFQNLSHEAYPLASKTNSKGSRFPILVEVFLRKGGWSFSKCNHPRSNWLLTASIGVCKHFHLFRSCTWLHLKIRDCPKLGSLPEEGLPSSLKYLEIQQCHRTLMERCKEGGEDWPKIKHIPKINIRHSLLFELGDITFNSSFLLE
ncbi:hypothetical protein Tsubulata_022732, partial [Turnera subulata]